MGLLSRQPELWTLYRRDVLAWSEDLLLEPPREWQPEVLDACNRGNVWIAVAACRKAGKTRLAAIIVLWWMTTRAQSLVVTIAPVWSQVVQAIWAEIRHVWARSYLPFLFPEWEVLTHEIKTPWPKWRALGLAAGDVQNLEGRHDGGGGVLVVIDESKGVPEEFFNSVQGMLGEAGTDFLLLAIGTPGPPRGWFYRAFAQERDLWAGSFKVRAPEIPRLAERADRERRRLGEKNPWYLQQQLAEFAGADENTVLPLYLVEKALGRPMAEPRGVKWPRVLSLDPAGSGKDDSVLSYRWGPVLLWQKHWNGWDEMRTARFAARQALELRPDVVAVDEVGIGAGIRSRVRELVGPASRVIGYNAGRKAKDAERYGNRKAEDLFNLRARFEAEDISIPDAPMLVADLTSYQWDYRGAKTVIVDPDDSPDFGDSCIIAFAADSRGEPVRGARIPGL